MFAYPRTNIAQIPGQLDVQATRTQSSKVVVKMVHCEEPKGADDGSKVEGIGRVTHDDTAKSYLKLFEVFLGVFLLLCQQLGWASNYDNVMAFIVVGGF